MSKKLVKNIMGTGIASMAGLSTLGAMGSISGMPKESSNIINVSSAGLTLANTGNLYKAGMSIIPKKTSKNKISKDKWKHDCSTRVINKII